MKMRWAARAIFCALLPVVTGCATGPGYDSMHAAEPAVAASQGRFYFYRDPSFEGWAIQPAIKIDGAKVGDSVPGGYFYVDEPPGTYKITATTEKEEAVNVTIAAGQSRYIRFDISMGLLIGHVSPSIIDPEQAAVEIKKCHFTRG